MSTIRTITVALSVLLAAQAEKPLTSSANKPRKKLAFESLDADHNGVLIRDEFLAGSVGTAAETKLEEFKTLDADRSGALDFDEFKKYQPARRTPEELAQQFAKLDKNGDDRLTVEELAADPGAPNESASLRTFVRLDANEDSFLTREEFQNRGPQVKVTASFQFYRRDLNNDGQLDRNEFLKPSIGLPFHEAAKVAFVRADVDGNGLLNLDEYLLTRVAEPSAETVFRALDGVKQDRLTLEELTRTMTPQHAAAIQESFNQFDVNRDGTWDPKEYQLWKLAREAEKGRAERGHHTLANYSTWIAAPILAAGVLLAVYARSRRLKQRPQVSPLPVQQPLPASDKRSSLAKRDAAELTRASSNDELNAGSDAPRMSSAPRSPSEEEPSMEHFDVK